MSAQANLAALFKPSESEIWQEDLLWQPVSSLLLLLSFFLSLCLCDPSHTNFLSIFQVPVHTIPKKLDILLHGGKNCPYYKVRHEYITEQSPEALGALEKYKDDIAFWSNHKEKNLKTIKDVVRLYKGLLSDKLNNKTYEPLLHGINSIKLLKIL